MFERKLVAFKKRLPIISPNKNLNYFKRTRVLSVMSGKPTYEELERKIETLHVKLHLSESNAREIQDLAKIGNWEWDLERQSLRWSDEIYHILGLEPVSFKPSPEAFEAAIHPDDLEDFLKQRDRMLNEKMKVCIDLRIILPDGSIRHVQERIQQIINRQGEVCRIIGTVHDVTDHMQTIEALRASEDRYRSFIYSIDDLVFVLDNNLVFKEYHSPKAPQLYVNPLDFIGKSIDEIGFPEQVYSLMKKALESAVKNNRSTSVEYYLDMPTGRFWFDCKITAFLNSYGEHKEVLCVVRDITDHKRAENSMQEAYQRLLTIFNSLDVMVYVADMETYEVLFANKRIKQHFGDITGKVCWQCLQKGQSAPCDFCYNEKLLDENGNPTAPYTFDNKNTITGQWYSNLDRVIVWHDGRLVRLCIATDITSRKQLESDLKDAKETLEIKVNERTLELQKSHAQLLHAEKMSSIGNLSASIAHEFNNPLQGVTSIVQGIKKRTDLDHDDAELVDLAIKECHRMRDLIKSLQDFHRPSSARKAPMDIHAVLESILMFSKKEFAIRKISITKKYAEDLPQIVAIFDQLKQVFLNILNNASDACAQGGDIIIETDTVGDNVVISVYDTGCGISLDDRKHIFEPFFTTKAGMKGTGLGLPVSYGIIKAHGGEITVDSEPEKGTVFSVILPIKGGSDIEK